MWFEEIKELLMAEDEQFRRIAAEHRRLDKELADLSSRKYLSPEDQRLEAELKKKKLAAKDRMLRMAEEYRKAHEGGK
ncbi:MAG: DUF465 domain-containing protein [Acidobacteria bacterium]|nr:DUF465 domain-containing protein [Acidobacteriota bacterium]